MIKEITVITLKQMIDNGSNFQLIDVREASEKLIADIGGELIPLGEIMNRTDEINPDKTVIIYCRSGKRSGMAVNALQEALGHEKMYNLKGGILAWSDNIDNSITKY